MGTKLIDSKRRFAEIDVYPLTFEPEMAWGKCFEKEEVDKAKVGAASRRQRYLLTKNRGGG
ncbi:MAG: hypothetical protein NOU37_08205 [Candidatus Brocadiales bacterium]|nr:hypothetical protein [Candidatus Bathyanammoxibius sp.]MCQ4575212.1 hypothetical protein [Candidatus Bathyanammoxibius amoris]